MFDLFVQTIIGIFGSLALLLTIKKNKWGPYIGIFTQPFWLWMSYDKGLWGVFLVSVLYLVVWIYGLVKIK